MEKTIKLGVDLRHKLHQIPELALKEVKTKKLLMQFLKKHTNYEIVDGGYYFYALKKVKGAKKTIMLRADFDAILNSRGVCFHGCGHDGHSAILATTAILAQELDSKVNVVFLFQCAEENAQGALKCLEVIKKEKVSEVFGLHNMPNFKKGVLYLKSDTFQCASKGLAIEVVGKQSHASMPEAGLNPSYFLTELLQVIKPLTYYQGYGPLDYDKYHFKGLSVICVTHLNLGHDNAYGINPANLKLELTLRASYDEDLRQLEKIVVDELKKAKKQGYQYHVSESDVFPATINHESSVLKLSEIFKANKLKYTYMDNPLRASEDFGYYLKLIKGSYMFLGAGKGSELHQDSYEFNDDLIEPGTKAFLAIIKDYHKF